MNKVLIGEIKLRNLDPKLRELDKQLISGLNKYQKEEYKKLLKLKSLNRKNKGNWQHRTGIMEARENLSTSWDKNQLLKIRQILSIITDMQFICKKYMTRIVSKEALCERYKLYYIQK